MKTKPYVGRSNPA